MNIDYFGQAEKMIKYLYPNENPMWAKDGSEIFLDEEDLKLIKKWVSLVHRPNTRENILSKIFPLSNDTSEQLLDSKL